MTAPMAGGIGWGVEALLGSALLMALVLLVRAPVRRAFGAQVAYALWALPVLRLALPPMPERWHAVVSTPVAAVGEQVTWLIVPSVAGPVVQAVAPTGPSLAIVLLAVWGVGAALVLAWHAIGYRRFRVRVLREATLLDTVDGIAVIESRAAPGPLAFGVMRRFVAFPTDFSARYDAAEQDLALAHEIGHHARGDLIANWVALAVLALHWLSPIAWLAFRAFRADQEMANDACVLARRTAADRHAYACAIVKAAHGGAVSAVCHLHTIDDLKGRLKMLGRTRATRARTWTGAAGVAVLALAGLGATASGTKAAATVREGVRDGVERVTGVDVAALAPETPPAIPQTVAPAAPPAAPAVPEASARKPKRVIVVKGGAATTYEGAEAEAYLAANPVAIPPLPPIPPVAGVAAVPSLPPMPPMPGGKADRDVTRLIVRRDGQPVQDRILVINTDVPRTVSRDCLPVDGQPVVQQEQQGGRRVMVICRNRIQQITSAAVARTMASRDVERNAYRSALGGLRNARAGIATNASMPAEGKTQALAAIDTSIAEIEADLAKVR